MKEKYDFKWILGFILFAHAEKNKAKEMTRVGLLLEKIRSRQAYSVTDIGKKEKEIWLRHH